MVEFVTIILGLMCGIAVRADRKTTWAQGGSA
jgi:hypothetical protein